MLIHYSIVNLKQVKYKYKTWINPSKLSVQFVDMCDYWLLLWEAILLWARFPKHIAGVNFFLKALLWCNMLFEWHKWSHMRWHTWARLFCHWWRDCANKWIWQIEAWNWPTWKLLLWTKESFSWTERFHNWTFSFLNRVEWLSSLSGI